MKKRTRNQTQDHSTVNMAVMAVMLAVSFFSVESSIGTGNEAQGQAMYTPYSMPAVYQNPFPYIYVAPLNARASSVAAKRAEKRNVRIGASNEPKCTDSECTNLINALEAGAPTCMRSKECVKQLNIQTASRYCANNRTCVLLRSLKDFYETSPDCITTSSPICEYDVRRIILLAH